MSWKISSFSNNRESLLYYLVCTAIIKSQYTGWLQWETFTFLQFRTLETYKQDPVVEDLGPYSLLSLPIVTFILTPNLTHREKITQLSNVCYCKDTNPITKVPSSWLPLKLLTFQKPHHTRIRVATCGTHLTYNIYQTKSLVERKFKVISKRMESQK